MSLAANVVLHIASDTRSPEADGTNSVTLRKQPGPASVTLRSEYSCVSCEGNVAVHVESRQNLRSKISGSPWLRGRGGGAI